MAAYSEVQEITIQGNTFYYCYSPSIVEVLYLELFSMIDESGLGKGFDPNPDPKKMTANSTKKMAVFYSSPQFGRIRRQLIEACWFEDEDLEVAVKVKRLTSQALNDMLEFVNKDISANWSKNLEGDLNNING